MFHISLKPPHKPKIAKEYVLPRQKQDVKDKKKGITKYFFICDYLQVFPPDKI